ncbi:3-keto-5-aminohexanoate cleavage protein [Streptosporangium sp. NPDC023825]|uniref:3-keto-5-aminohexanoate cleavage protein n=1 Tax=Streptosporangium sp. NPDC023825 TaxID=3154909 RepID=UPI00342D826F
MDPEVNPPAGPGSDPAPRTAAGGGAEARGGTAVRRGEATWLKACLNGARRPGDHPALPLTPLELAEAAREARGAGADAVHLHPRDEAGSESLSAAHVGAAVRAVREACPGLPVGVSTGLWITGGDVDARRDAVRGWAALAPGGLPDFASVNLSEPGFEGLWHDLRRLGVGVEAGVWSVDDADALAATGLDCVRVLVEILGGPAGTAVSRARAVLDRLAELGVPGPRLLHGEGDPAWILLDEAGQSGLATRIGLEDVLHSPVGDPVGGNAELVRLARARLA